MNESKSKEHLLIEYIQEGNIGNFAKLLLSHDTINVNHADKYGTTALHVAAMEKKEEIIDLLLKHPTINPLQQDIYGSCYFDFI